MPNENDCLIEMCNISAHVRLGNGEWLTTVNNASMRCYQGQTYAIVGCSGSGKTSLISIVGLLNNNFIGIYRYHGQEIQHFHDRTLSMMRANSIGFVFQNYSLIGHLNIQENVELPLMYAKKSMSKRARNERVLQALHDVGLDHKLGEYPNKLSGGEQQRVAIARALVTDPELLVCDEPTGALDKRTGEKVLQLLHQRVQQSGTTLLLVTHDELVASSCASIFTMEGGVLHANAL